MSTDRGRDAAHAATEANHTDGAAAGAGATSGTTRRKFITLGVGTFVVGSVATRGLGLFASKRRLVRRTVPVMGTIAEVGIVSEDTARAEAAIDAALEELYRVNRTMSRFTALSDIGRANLEAHRGPVAVSAATAQVVGEALRWSEGVAGRWDPAIGRVCALWDVKHRTTPPPAEQVAELAGRRFFQAVEVGRRAGTPVLYYHSADAGLDLGGIAKGWAVDRAIEAIRARGFRDAIVNAGGDLYAMGHSERGDAWEIGIQDPRSPGRIARTFPLSDGAVATSGDYVQYFEYQGRRYHHIMDPITAEPRRTPVHSVTIAASNCMTADVACGTIYGLGRDQAVPILARLAGDARLLDVET